MIMNSLEYWAMNNPIRGFIQRRYEAPKLKRLSSKTKGSVLEIGCGQGIGAKIIYDLFKPQKYVGIDLDPKMVKRAQRRGRKLKNAQFLEADAAKSIFANQEFDLVVDFGIIHHIPNWKDCLSEINRTLKVGGEFLFEELSLDTWERGIGKPLRRILEHPYDDMFRQKEFLEELERIGFEVKFYEKNPITLHYFWGKATKKS